MSTDLKEIIYTNANQYFERLIELIDHAEQTIYLEAYIFDDDFVGQAVSCALEQAALRGVSVRVLVDGVGAGRGFEHIARLLVKCGAKVRVFRPLPWRFELWPFSLFPDKGVLHFWYLLSYINKRNHRKVVVTDQKVALVGSLNITKDHLPSDSGGKDFRDMAVEVHGADLSNLMLAFDALWNREPKRRLVSRMRPSHFRYNITRSQRTLNRQRLLSRIQEAKSRIWISNAYFVPDKVLMTALTDASKRGVDVRIMVPGHSDIFFIPWASSYFYTALLDAGARIYELHGSLLHSKTLMIDQWASIGSSNLNTRSLMHDLELDYSLQLPEARDQLKAHFLEDCMSSVELNSESNETRHFWHRYLGGFLLLLFSYWV